ncbi:hypothetical protein AB0B89_20390 [Sphaerisporangium sp. NPDC049002]|uniref:hypothetical protein n=1 Tax=Sphaerisporangium sp. NPDC049002 TaxID=3155392 RepID=UPI0033C84B4D
MIHRATADESQVRARWPGTAGSTRGGSYVWEQSIQGVMRWGIAYKATDFVRTTPGMPEQVA